MLKALVTEIHENAVEKGFWENVDYQKFVALMISEVGEAVESDRTGKYADRETFEFMGRTSSDFKGSFETYIKDTFEDELADVYIRLLDFCGGFSVDIDKFGSPISRGDLTPEPNDLFGWLNELASSLSSIGKCITAGYKIMADGAVERSLVVVGYICETRGIDLDWHVKMKMQYNATRERLHGKKY